jgi:hypothetical protein
MFFFKREFFKRTTQQYNNSNNNNNNNTRQITRCNEIHNRKQQGCGTDETRTMIAAKETSQEGGNDNENTYQ